MIVADVMSFFPATVDVRAPARHALATAMLHGVHHLVVMDGQKLVGTVCRCELEQARARVPVARCIQRPAVIVRCEQTLAEAARTLLAQRVGCLAVVDAAGVLRGALTRRDLCHARALPDISVCDECGVERPLRTSCPDKPGVCQRCAGRRVESHPALVAES